MKTIKLSTLIENPDNPQTVTDEAFADLCNSIERDEARLELRPIAFVTDYVTAAGTSLAGKRVVIDGNKRLRALKKLRGESAALPAKYFYDMTACSVEERKRWLVRSNIQSGEWDTDALAKLYTPEELADITSDEALAELLEEADKAETEQREEAERNGFDFDNPEAASAPEADNPEYQSFVDKFKPKKTTDDCYTPKLVYDAIADWVAKHYNLERGNFVRPFVPGGDYQAFAYPAGSVVVDNPPFSIISDIVRWYLAHKIQFFIFAPGLTLFSSVANEPGVHYVVAHYSITYANGAKVSTSFITSLGENFVEVSPDLRQAMKEADERNLKEQKKQVANLQYPMSVATAARLGWLSCHGTPFVIKREDAVYIRALDAQGENGIFGGALLISERAAAERAAAERAAAERDSAICFELSPREIEIQKKLGK